MPFASLPPPNPRNAGFALFALGFRPFYLLAGAFAALGVPLWVLQWSGHLAAATPLPPIAWHAHEMVFAFAVAVVTGFLFTAARTWTQLPTPTGWPLAAFALLWLAARVAILVGPYPLALALDLAFLPLVALALARVLARAADRRNDFLVGLLGLLAGINALFHASMLGAVRVPWPTTIEAALAVIVLIVTVLAGRVIPTFTRNATGSRAAANRPWVERSALATLVAAFAAYLGGASGWLLASLSVAAAAAHALRLAGWDPLATRRDPILWILHLSYAWIPIGFALLGASALTDRVASALAMHAFGVGAIGGMTIGMMTRTARGHTGRELRASPAETLAYGLVHLAAAARVLVPLAMPSAIVTATTAAGVLWSAAFLVYTLVFWPILSRPRVDGRPG